MVTRTLAALPGLFLFAGVAAAQAPAPPAPTSTPPTATSTQPGAGPPAAAPAPPGPAVTPGAAAPGAAVAPAAPSGPAAAPGAPRAAVQLPGPVLHHAPVSVARHGEPLIIDVLIEHPELLRGATVVYRKSGGAFASRPLERAPGAAYAATIPAAAVTAPGIAYTIEIERLDGVRAAAFATRADPQPVQVLEDRAVVREAALLDRVKGRRSVATASAELVRFGSTRGDKPLPCTPGQEGCGAGGTGVPDVDDQYYRVEAGYTYRPLGTVAEFSLRAGFVRGTSLVPTETLDASKYKVGLNYGAPTVRFRLADAWHLETEFLTSITEVGFSVGAGGALLIGDPYGSKVTLGLETIGFEEGTYFGSRFYSRVDIAAADRFTIAPIVEVTDMPHATSYGVRLLGEATVDLGAGFGASLRGGYQARRSTSGGPSVGGGVSLAF